MVNEKLNVLFDCIDNAFQRVVQDMVGVAFSKVEKVLPVDVYVPGCCPRPEAIIDGIYMAMGKINDKSKVVKKG